MNARVLLSLPGLSLFLAVHALATVCYVDLNSTNPTPPFTNWMTAATNIQDAVDVAGPGDFISVNDGTYAFGGRVVFGSLTNRVAIHKAITVQSVNGSGATTIRGNNTLGNAAVRCVYLTNNAALIGFTLASGGTRNAGDATQEQSGGGAWCETTNALLANCIFNGSLAAYVGGGVFQGTLTNCTISGCVANFGGGAASSVLTNCTLSGNSTTPSSLPNNHYGGGAYTCMLSGCTLSGNSACHGGGGAASSTLYNCSLLNNSAALRASGCYDYSFGGGGAMSSTLINCVVSGNTAAVLGGSGLSYCNLTNCLVTANQGANYAAYGGTLTACVISGNQDTGADHAVLNNCLVTGNSYGGISSSTAINCTIVRNNNVSKAGGATSSTLANCVLYNNSSILSGANYDSAVTLNYCCTTPLPTGGTGNISSDPLLVNPGGGDFHLQTNSPCINSGNNSFVVLNSDLDGNARISGGTVDIGAYEIQNPGSLISFAWLQQYGLPTDGSADFTDTDRDGMNNWQEWICGTDPTNPLSVLKMLVPSPGPSGTLVSWQSVQGKTYYLLRGTNLSTLAVLVSVRSNLTGKASTTTFLDAGGPGAGPVFYRIGVQQ